MSKLQLFSIMKTEDLHFRQYIQLIVCIFAVYLTSLFWNRRRFRDFMLVGGARDMHAAIKEGTRKYPNRAFAVPSSPPLVIIPVSMIDEFKSLPENKVSAARELFRRSAGHYSKMGTNSLAAIKAIKTDLNRKPSVIPIIIEESEYAFSTQLGRHDDWTSMPVFSNINRIVAMVSGRIFIGKTLSRQEEWVDISAHWSNDVFDLLRATEQYPAWVRPYILPYLSETKRVLHQRKRATAFLGPTFEQQLHAKLNDLPPPKEEEESLATWLIKYLAPRHMQVESLVRHQLSVTWASIQTSTMAVTQIIFDLAAQPVYQHLLRAELERVLEECGGELAQVDLGHLVMMDSFMKESLRMSPNTIGELRLALWRYIRLLTYSTVAPLRLTVEPITLSTGQVIPAGIPIGFYSYSINMNPDLYEKPETFDGLRSYRLRKKEGEEQKHKFGTTGPNESFDFGHGIHACPGRFFACTEIKLMFAHVLRTFDLKLKEGQERPPNDVDGLWFVIDQDAEVFFRRRNV